MQVAVMPIDWTKIGTGEPNQSGQSVVDRSPAGNFEKFLARQRLAIPIATYSRKYFLYL